LERDANDDGAPPAADWMLIATATICDYRLENNPVFDLAGLHADDSAI
jgi:hypothetical protein